MIDFHYETYFELGDETKYADWISRIVVSEGFDCDQLDYIFCDDEYLLKINQDYLDHDTYTDIITFPYGDLNVIAGDIFISVERVKENAVNFRVDFELELKRVMAHGVLHLLGYGDKSEEEVLQMRLKEDEKIKLFHVEH
ncbi:MULTISPECIES: rRNA maturation RNase YbeY [unclassified Arenibacter]|jgi:rRNA maturation RNase YbeY|uniref:rRNA maturation RNase YbeY n=1 Tax=unclassified Arenibacter TaxID=2615047 RepID=UPI000E35420D|nr:MULTISPECIES: rRNA maturation RNase YbeY [unclassified Arenibacter]MCM4165921.1 rRNA maturation RNase YbeY [Arenibacter sp. A80]RFT54430.1 rRNA maturation RNase YbeY [Arenibacter sp. P308M17]